MNWKKRTVNCGQLRDANVEEKVILNGWVDGRRDLGGLIFFDIRDRYGVTQVVIEPENYPEVAERGKEVRSEYVLWVEGKVRHRESPNKKMPTGLIEIQASDFGIINKAKLPPFDIKDGLETNEETKLTYRYLDLRRPELQKKFMVRNKLYQIVHKFYSENDFMEIETPVLMKSTPEGARDFLVPSRINKGRFYALPQSPQIFKQLLMVSGFDRYMQIVKCFRDEDLRSDRQPEFTQIDVEMSFVTQDDILDMHEKLIRNIWKEILNYDVPEKFERMTWMDAMINYGSDKPDLRFDMQIQYLCEAVTNSEFKVFQDTFANDGLVGCINAKGCSKYSRKMLDELTDFAKRYGAKGLAWMKFDNGEVKSPIAKRYFRKSQKTV